LKLAPIIRFIFGALVVAKFALDQSTENVFDADSKLRTLVIASDIVSGFLILLFAAYCLVQGLNELRGRDHSAKYLILYAILFETVNVLGGFYVLTILNEYTLVTTIIPLSVILGMSYLLTRDIRVFRNA